MPSRPLAAIPRALIAALLLVSLSSGPSAAALPNEGPTLPAPPMPAGPVPPAAHLRALFVDAFDEGLRTPAEIDQVVATTKAANLNAIFAQVVRRGDCFCVRAGLPRAEAAIAPAPFDPLETLIERAHAQGIEVHAWVISTAVWQGTRPPADPAHVFNRHGPTASGTAAWLTRRSDGVMRSANDWHVDPGHPDAADWIVDSALAIVRNYAVDGINLDRVRYPDLGLAGQPSWGYNPTAIARFQRATGRADLPAASDAQWAQWRRDQVTSIVRRIYLGAYAIRPGVRVSADVISYGNGPQSGGWTTTRAYAEQLQDWRAWLEEGIIDLAIPMNYKRDADAAQRRMYDEWTEFAKDHQYRRQTAIAPAPYLNDIAGSVRQLRGALAPSAAGTFAAGWVGYSYRTPDSRTDAGTRAAATARALLVDALVRDAADGAPPPFATAAPVPAMPWKARPTLGHASGTAAADSVVRLVDAAGATVRETTADARGWFGFVDLAPGDYRVAAGAVTTDVSVSAGRIASALSTTGTVRARD